MEVGDAFVTMGCYAYALGRDCSFTIKADFEDDGRMKVSPCPDLSLNEILRICPTDLPDLTKAMRIVKGIDFDTDDSDNIWLQSAATVDRYDFKEVCACIRTMVGGFENFIQRIKAKLRC